MAMMLPAVGALKVTSGCPLAVQSTDNRHDNGSGSKINVVLLNNGAKIVQSEHNAKQKRIFCLSIVKMPPIFDASQRYTIFIINTTGDKTIPVKTRSYKQLTLPKKRKTINTISTNCSSPANCAYCTCCLLFIVSLLLHGLDGVAAVAQQLQQTLVPGQVTCTDADEAGVFRHHLV